MITVIGEEFHITGLDLDKGLLILEGVCGPRILRTR